MKHSEVRERALAIPQVQAAFDQMAPEFARLREMLHAGQAAGLSQAEMAERIGTEAPTVTLPVTPVPG